MIEISFLASAKQVLMNLDHLVYFLAVIKHGSFSDAARHSYVTPQTVSKAIRDLERELGIPLFVRTNRGIAPTPFSLDFASRSERVIAEYRELQDFARRYRKMENQETSGTVKVAIASAGERCTFFREEDFSAFRADYPNIQLEIRNHPSEVCLSAFREGFVDAAILLGTCDNASCTKLADIRPSLMVGKRHPLSANQSVRLKEIEPYQTARPLDIRHCYATIKQICRSKAIRLRIVDVGQYGRPYKEFLDENGIIFVGRTSLLLESHENAQIIALNPCDEIIFSLFFVTSPDCSNATELARMYFESIAENMAARI